MQLNNVGFRASDLPVQDLIRLRDEIDAELSVKRRIDLEAAAQQVRELSRELGFSIEELIPVLRPAEELPVRYRHPDRPELVWCGKGRRPLWLNEAIDAGIPLAKIRVDQPGVAA